VKNGLLAGAWAEAVVELAAGALADDAGAELLGACEQAARLIDMAITIERRRGMKAPQGVGPGWRGINC
jgi:hypothetical protein